MVEEVGKVEGDLRIDGDFVLRGMVTGTITVTEGGYCELHGVVGTDLIIEPGGIVTLHGMVIRDVFNRGGDLEIFGIIKGALHDEKGTTLVDAKAVIGRNRGQ